MVSFFLHFIFLDRDGPPKSRGENVCTHVYLHRTKNEDFIFLIALLLLWLWRGWWWRWCGIRYLITCSHSHTHAHTVSKFSVFLVSPYFFVCTSCEWAESTRTHRLLEHAWLAGRKWEEKCPLSASERRDWSRCFGFHEIFIDSSPWASFFLDYIPSYIIPVYTICLYYLWSARFQKKKGSWIHGVHSVFFLYFYFIPPWQTKIQII